MSARRNLPAAITLFLMAPLVAEFLLGDFPIKWLLLVIVLAPMYGGGALLIRELARRRGRGWPTMLVLGAAYALLEEGFVTQSLFNPNYLHFHFLAYAYVPALGMGGWWTLLMLNVHAFWSIGVSIALVEALHPEGSKSPWLGRGGVWLTAAMVVAGSYYNAAYGRRHDHFVATHAQFLWAGVGCGLLIVGPFLLPRRREQTESGAVPGPWILGAGAFVMGMVVMTTPPVLGWGACAIMLAADGTFLAVVEILSRREAWRPMHTLGVAGGGAMVYGVHSFLQMPVVPTSVPMARAGNAVFLLAAIAVVMLAARRSARV